METTESNMKINLERIKSLLDPDEDEQPTEDTYKTAERILTDLSATYEGVFPRASISLNYQGEIVCYFRHAGAFSICLTIPSAEIKEPDFYIYKDKNLTPYQFTPALFRKTLQEHYPQQSSDL